MCENGGFSLSRSHIIYTKTVIQVVNKGAARSGSPTQNGQGERVVKSRYRPRNGCDGWSMAKKLITTIQANSCFYPNFTRNQHKIFT